MAIIQAFKALRPIKDKVHLIASKPFDSYSTTELNTILKENPYSFLHIIQPEFPFNRKRNKQDPAYLELIKRNFEWFKSEEYLISDNKPSYYIYRQQSKSKTYTGIIACASVEDYLSGVIKKHEQTLTEKENRLKDYLEVCDFNAEPVCIAYPDNPTINEILLKTTKSNPEYDFTTADSLRHTLWILNDEIKMNSIESEFEKIPSVYIADGHHRSASSALLGKHKREMTNKYTGKEGFNFFMCVFFSENQLNILDFNRVVKDTNGLSTDELLQKISKDFEISTLASASKKPEKKHCISMYLDGKWYQLRLKITTNEKSDPVGSLDASLLSNLVLSPILGIKDLKTDKRIKFVPGVKGAQELEKLVDEGKFKIAFALFPVEMNQIKQIADSNGIMPPKTTWVEPKMRSGLVIYSLSDKLS